MLDVDYWGYDAKRHSFIIYGESSNMLHIQFTIMNYWKWVCYKIIILYIIITNLRHMIRLRQCFIFSLIQITIQQQQQVFYKSTDCGTNERLSVHLYVKRAIFKIWHMDTRQHRQNIVHLHNNNTVTFVHTAIISKSTH